MTWLFSVKGVGALLPDGQFRGACPHCGHEHEERKLDG